MFFRSAVRRKLIAANPFADVKPPKAAEANKQVFVERETVERRLAVCDPTWQVIIALNRYGGLRCPSEVLSLRWMDIDWERGRMVVHSPKTEHHSGKANRTVPLFLEIRGVLEDAFERASASAEYVVDVRYREQAFAEEKGWRNCNMRPQFDRLVDRAGLDPWPCPFNSMRGSRETELAAGYPLHVVTAWIGNTTKIAAKCYLKITEADYERASGVAVERAAAERPEALQNALQ